MIVYGCQTGVDVERLRESGVAVLTLPCSAALPPAFLDLIITRHYADGVLLTGCAAGDCFYRLGIHWTQQRIAGLRDPRLRARVPHERVATCWTGVSGSGRLKRELEAFRATLKGLAPLEKREPASRQRLVEQASSSD